MMWHHCTPITPCSTPMVSKRYTASTPWTLNVVTNGTVGYVVALKLELMASISISAPDSKSIVPAKYRGPEIWARGEESMSTPELGIHGTHSFEDSEKLCQRPNPER